MDLVSTLEASFNVVERLQDRRLALRLFQCAHHLNDLFISPARVERYAHLMRDDTLKIRDAVALKRELDDARPSAQRALSALSHLTRYEMSRVAFRPSERAALASIAPTKTAVRTSIDDLLKAYSWRRMIEHPEWATGEAASLFDFDASTPAPLSKQQLDEEVGQLEARAKRLSAALDRAFDHLTASPRRAPLSSSNFVAALVGGVIIFGLYSVAGAFLEPYVDRLFQILRDWLTSIGIINFTGET